MNRAKGPYVSTETLTVKFLPNSITCHDLCEPTLVVCQRHPPPVPVLVLSVYRSEIDFYYIQREKDTFYSTS